MRCEHNGKCLSNVILSSPSIFADQGIFKLQIITPNVKRRIATSRLFIERKPQPFGFFLQQPHYLPSGTEYAVIVMHKISYKSFVVIVYNRVCEIYVVIEMACRKCNITLDLYEHSAKKVSQINFTYSKVDDHVRKSQNVKCLDFQSWNWYRIQACDS